MIRSNLKWSDNGDTFSSLFMQTMQSDSKLINIERLQLYQQLFIYGQLIPLSFKFDVENFRQEIKEFDDRWVVYNKSKGFTGRHGLSITSLDGQMTGEPDLQSLYEYSHKTGAKVSENQFNVPTEAYKKLTTLHPLLNYFTGGLGRCRVVRFEAGGFFPPHRDQSVQYQVPDYFRILVPLSHANRNSFYFVLDRQLISLEPGRAYLFNALQEHSVFSFQNDVYTLAMSLVLNQENIRLAINSFEIK